MQLHLLEIVCKSILLGMTDRSKNNKKWNRNPNKGMDVIVSCLIYTLSYSLHDEGAIMFGKGRDVGKIWVYFRKRAMGI